MIDWLAELIVTDHAVSRARQRLGWVGAALDLAYWVRGDIRLALLLGNVGSVRPNWTSAYESRRVDATVAYVWDEQGSRCWVTLPSTDGRQAVVKTLLLDYLEKTEIAADARIRRR